MVKSLLLAAGLLTTTVAYGTDVYRCIDADAKIGYYALPQADQQCERRVTVPPPTPVPGQNSTATRPSPRTPAASTNSQSAATGQQSREDLFAQNCQTAKANLEMLQSERDVVIVDAEGSKGLLDDSQRQDSITRTQREIDYYCNP